MKKAILFAVVALVVPSVALASTPSKGSKSKSAPKVLYVLKGTLSGYTAATSTSAGSITIAIARSNYHAKALKGQSLTIPTSAKTKVSLQKKLKTITDGDKGVVKVMAAKKVAAADLASTLQASTAKQIVDLGAPKAKK